MKAAELLLMCTGEKLLAVSAVAFRRPEKIVMLLSRMNVKGNIADHGH